MRSKILDRADASELTEPAKLFILAAYESDEQLTSALEGAARGERPAIAAPVAVDVPSTYLTNITVTGFRGIGPQASLDLEAKPGLTLVVGRNGSGKSSFAEAAEIALTGANARWENRGTVWRDGWRNLHWGDSAPTVSVHLDVDGEGVTVARTWHGEDVADSSVWTQRRGARREYADLGWRHALAAYRPFLSYSELGAMLQGKPSELYDSLYSILGLEQVAIAQQRLAGAFRELDGEVKETAADKKRLIIELAGVDDDRARRAAAALSGRAANLDAADEVLRSTTEPEGDLAALRSWMTLTPPDPQAAAAAADAVEAAVAAMAKISGGDSDQARRLAALLEQALEHAHTTHDAACPVCGATDRLDDAWRTATATQVARLKETAAEADRTRAGLRAARTAAAATAAAPPAFAETVPVGIAADGLFERWRAWAEDARSEDAPTVVAALRDATARLAEDIAEAAEAARAEVGRREDVWQPVARHLQTYVERARGVGARAEVRVDLKAACDWLKGQAGVLRDEGLAPIAAKAAEVWRSLRRESSVDLGPVRLEGSNTKRRVALDVTVDGVSGTALGVMSQGELHALSLALFLPRAMLDQSPFRFLVIDDPVQAMDPAKVEGLANVLAEVARTHQVVVFTHDDRLPEAVRRLQIQAPIQEVHRKERSVVELTLSADPVSRYLEDARAVASTSGLPDDIRQQVVAGFCRNALEAACHEVIRRKRLGRGERHADVESAIAGATTLTATTALALFDDAQRGGEVLSHYNARQGQWAGDVHQMCNKGVHGGRAVESLKLARDTYRLTEWLRGRTPVRASR
ncbi:MULTISPECIES: AAA family ATPase [unclassified Modestobacter]|uniref:AAA family ATPase n=1 Tax=unclassified Modestobacter TaxID=2643866 RepID=UPI0022AACE48|nr:MULTISPECIES: AAA family ATPase [unclassified Modestobacter]MCZ2826036.1 AAA family ATPase [Modestobacter sp. VKM Ac-2981]MCZ2852899.1 AAA family ATPase [Modestobacter sp. VKM Ac-2982]